MDNESILLPEALLKRLRTQLGDEFDPFLKSLDTPSPTSIRLNPGKFSNRFSDARTVLWEKSGRYLAQRPRFTSDPLFHAGTYYVQEASSMFLGYLIPRVIDLDRSLKVLDLSSAPGGKATHLQSLISNDSLLVANEVISSRNKILRQNLARWGKDNHIVTQSDPKYFRKLPDFFDLILVDAPCSGEGLIRKDPEARNEWSEDNVNLCSRRQKRILADIVPSLAPGGVLLYSTCTFSESENEENMEWLIEESGLDPIAIDLPPDWKILTSGQHQAGYRFYPHRIQGEGFFIAAFQKSEFVEQKPKRTKRSTRPRPTSPATHEDRRWLENEDRYVFMDREQHRSAIPKTIFEDYQKISQVLRITYAGLYLGKVYHGKLKPSPELALSQYLSRGVKRLELDDEFALNYLAHMDHGIKEVPASGFHLVTHQGHGLGWIHVLETGQIRNKYPAAWRILQRYVK